MSDGERRATDLAVLARAAAMARLASHARPGITHIHTNAEREAPMAVSNMRPICDGDTSL